MKYIPFLGMLTLKRFHYFDYVDEIKKQLLECNPDITLDDIDWEVEDTDDGTRVIAKVPKKNIRVRWPF